MKKILAFMLIAGSLAANAQDSRSIPLVPQTVFFRFGFSGILEFNQSPTRIVVGDQKSFQVERLGKSLVVRPVVDFGSSNLFVFFETGDPKLFLLIASEDANPSHYLKVSYPKEEPKPKPVVAVTSSKSRPTTGRSLMLKSASFDLKKDYLTVEATAAAGSASAILPEWPNAKIVFKDRPMTPLKAWAERKDVQKDSFVKARFVFLRPNLPRDLKGARLVIPVKNEAALTLDLRLSGGAR